MDHLHWHHYLLVISGIASIAGLFLLKDHQGKHEDLKESEIILLRMTFSYWLVYCLAVGLQKLPLPEWEYLWLSLRFTTIVTYFLTFACVLSLPLHHVEVRRQPE